MSLVFSLYNFLYGVNLSLTALKVFRAVFRFSTASSISSHSLVPNLEGDAFRQFLCLFPRFVGQVDDSRKGGHGSEHSEVL